MIGDQIKEANKIPFIHAFRTALNLTSDTTIYNDLRYKRKKGGTEIAIGRALKIELNGWKPNLREIRSLEEVLINYNCKIEKHYESPIGNSSRIFKCYRFKLEFIDKNY